MSDEQLVDLVQWLLIAAMFLMAFTRGKLPKTTQLTILVCCGAVSLTGSFLLQDWASVGIIGLSIVYVIVAGTRWYIQEKKKIEKEPRNET